MICKVKIFRSEGLEEYLRAQTVHPPVLGLDRLVDNIPTMDPAAVPTSQLLDMVDDRPFLLLPVGQVEIPAGCAVVPQQIVAAQDELIDARKVSDSVGRTIGVIAGGASVHDLPFHLVLGNN